MPLKNTYILATQEGFRKVNSNDVELSFSANLNKLLNVVIELSNDFEELQESFSFSSDSSKNVFLKCFGYYLGKIYLYKKQPKKIPHEELFSFISLYCEDSEDIIESDLLPIISKADDLKESEKLEKKMSITDSDIKQLAKLKAAKKSEESKKRIKIEDTKKKPRKKVEGEKPKKTVKKEKKKPKTYDLTDDEEEKPKKKLYNSSDEDLHKKKYSSESEVEVSD